MSDNYISRVEKAVIENVAVGKVRVLGVIEAEVSEREDYWERMYYVAWVNEREAGTHRVCIDSKGQSMLVHGHYQLSEDEAVLDMLTRVGFEVK